MAVSLQGVVAMGWAFLPLSFIFVCLRLYVRWYLQATVSLSDIFVIIAWLCFGIQNATSTYITVMEHWTLAGFAAFFEDPKKMYKFMDVQKGIALPYIIALYAIKGSFLLFYHKFFPPSFVKLRWALYLTTFLCVACFIISIVIEIMMCNPIDHAFMSRRIPPRCKEWQYRLYKPAYLGGITQDMVTDVLVYILPLFLLPTLHLGSKRKTAGLVITFSVGLLVVVCTITRLISKKWIDKPTDVAFIISNTQLCAGIIVACLPPLKWLYHSFKYHQRTTGHVTVASATDSQAKSDNKPPSPSDSSPSSEGEKGENSLFATSSADAVSTPSHANVGGVKGGWKSLRVTTRSKGSKSSSGSGNGSAGRTALTWSTWDPDEEEILAKFGEYDSNGAVPVSVDEGQEDSNRRDCESWDAKGLFWKSFEQT